MGVLKVGHVGLRTGIQRVDDHLAVDRSSNFHAAVLKVRRNRVDAPIAFADRAEIEVILDRAAAGNYGVRTLIHQVVQSRIFRDK